MSNAIELEKCVLEGIESKKKNGLIISRLKFLALFDRSAAKAIGAEYTVFTKDAEIRTTYTEMQLDFTMHELKLQYVVKGLENRPLDIRSQGAEKFVLKRKGDGKKKATKLMVQFRVVHVGHYLELTSWWEAQGGTEGIITLTPQQAELPLTQGKPATERREVGPKQVELQEDQAASARKRVAEIVAASAAARAPEEFKHPVLDGGPQLVKRGPGRPKKVTEVIQ